MTPSEQSNTDARRIAVGQDAAAFLGFVDDELLKRHDEACDAMSRYAILLAKRSGDPMMVLGQMVQIPTVVFCQRLLPEIVRGEDLFRGEDQ